MVLECTNVPIIGKFTMFYFKFPLIKLTSLEKNREYLHTSVFTGIVFKKFAIGFISRVSDKAKEFVERFYDATKSYCVPISSHEVSYSHGCVTIFFEIYAPPKLVRDVETYYIQKALDLEDKFGYDENIFAHIRVLGTVQDGQ